MINDIKDIYNKLTLINPKLYVTTETDIINKINELETKIKDIIIPTIPNIPDISGI